MRPCSKDKKNKKDKKGKGGGGGEMSLNKFFEKEKAANKGVISMVSGKRIKMKVDKNKHDEVLENNRSELLKFLNDSYD